MVARLHLVEVELISFQAVEIVAGVLPPYWQQEWPMQVCEQGTVPTVKTNQTYGTLASVQVAHTRHV